MDKVLLGMSGGVDSTAAALILQKEGYRVEGLTLWLCGTEEGVREAKETAAHLGIPHHVLDLRTEFEITVQAPFRKAYMEGKTPNPCVLCNTEIKFAALYRYAESLHIPFIATGHYAALTEKDGSVFLKTAQDTKKDQTYFLSQVPPALLPRLLLPLGGYTKEQVRQLAAEKGLAAAKKRDSQEICFIPDNDYVGYLEASPEFSPKEGKILDENGYTVGFHQGVHRYTIGQRKGLGAFGKKVFVTGVSGKENTVTIGENAALFCRGLVAENINAFGEFSGEVLVKIRSNAPAAPAVCRMEGEKLFVAFPEPQRAVTPGQTVAVYKESLLLAGATIVSPVF